MDIEKLDMLFDGENFVMIYDGVKLPTKFSPTLVSHLWRKFKSFDELQKILLNECKASITHYETKNTG